MKNLNRGMIVIMIILLSITIVNAKSAYDQLEDMAGDSDIYIAEPTPVCYQVSEADRIKYNIPEYSCDDINGVEKTTPNKVSTPKPTSVVDKQTDNQINYPTLYPTYRVGDIITNSKTNKNYRIKSTTEHVGYIYRLMVFSEDSDMISESTELYKCNEICDYLSRFTEENYFPYGDNIPTSVNHEFQRDNYMESALTYLIDDKEYRHYEVVQIGNFELVSDNTQSEYVSDRIEQPSQEFPYQTFYIIMGIFLLIIMVCLALISKGKKSLKKVG